MRPPGGDNPRCSRSGAPRRARTSRSAQTNRTTRSFPSHLRPPSTYKLVTAWVGQPVCSGQNKEEEAVVLAQHRSPSTLLSRACSSSSRHCSRFFPSCSRMNPTRVRSFSSHALGSNLTSSLASLLPRSSTSLLPLSAWVMSTLLCSRRSRTRRDRLRYPLLQRRVHLLRQQLQRARGPAPEMDRLQRNVHAEDTKDVRSRQKHL